MKNRLLAFLLAVLTLLAALILPVAAGEPEDPAEPPAPVANYETATAAAKVADYASVKEKLTAEIAAGYTELYAQSDKYQLFCNKFTGEVYLRDRTTGQYLTTNPVNPHSKALSDRLSQVWMSFKTFETDAVEKRYTSFDMAAQKGQITVRRIKNGIRVEYTLGDVSSRYVAPQAILDTDFQESILFPLEEYILSILNYEFITERFDTFVDVSDPERKAVYERLNELHVSDDLKWFQETAKEILGKYSVSTSKKEQNKSVNSRFYHDYREKYEYLYGKEGQTNKGALNSKDAAERAQAQELADQMLEQIKLLVPSAKELPSATVVGVALNNLYKDIGSLSSDYGDVETNVVDLNKLLADPEKNKATIEALKEEYPILKKAPAEGEAYPLIRKLVFSRDKTKEANTIAYFKKIEKYFTNSIPSYTLSTMLEQEEKVGYEALIFDNPLFRCALEYTIDDTGVTVDIPASSIIFDESKYQLTELSFLRYFCAGETDQDGYIFYPDGSGALIYNKTMPSSAVMNQPIYSYDYSFANLRLNSSSTLVNSSQPVRLPVFGAVNSVNTGEVDAGSNPIYQNMGYLAVITEGESLARVIATHLDDDGAFVGAYASYTLRPSDSYAISRLTEGAPPVPVTADFKYTGRFTQKYVVLNDTAEGYRADYVGMADAYRAYLFGNGTLSALDASELKARLPLFIETYASVKAKDTVLSFPVEVDKPLTTFKDVMTIGDDLRSEGIGNVKFRLIGYYNDGYQGYYPNRVKWMKEVGGKKGFKSLMNYVSENAEDGFEAYTDVDLVYDYKPGKAGGISKKKNLARSMDDRYVRKVMYSTIYRDTTSNLALLVSASKLQSLFAKFDKKFSKFKSTAVSLAYLASDLSSNFNEDDYFTREEAKTMVAGTLETASGKYSVMATGGNVYAIPYVDYLLQAPVDGSHFNSVSRTVPFFGMVMHGSLQYAGEVFNEAGNPDYEILRDIESGAAMYVVLVKENTDLMKEDAELIKHYAANYGYWRDDLVSYYDVLDYAIGDLQTYRITDHQFLCAERTIQDWEIEADAKTLEEEYLAILQKQFEAELTLRNRLIVQLWYVEIPSGYSAQQMESRISTFATKMMQGSYGDALKTKICAVADAINPDFDPEWSDAQKQTARSQFASAALTKMIDPGDAEYDASAFTLVDPDEARKLDLANAILEGNYGTEPKEKIQAVVTAITPDYPAGTDQNLIKVAALKKLLDPADPEWYGVQIGATKVQVTIDADAIKADAKNALHTDKISEWLSGEIDAFAAENASADGIMGFTVSGVTDYENETEYSFVTASDSADPAYKKTSYTISDGSIVLVTYSNGTDTVRFLLNFGIFSVNVRLNGQTYNLGKYDFLRLDPRADQKTDPRKQ